MTRTCVPRTRKGKVDAAYAPYKYGPGVALGCPVTIAGIAWMRKTTLSDWPKKPLLATSQVKTWFVPAGEVVKLVVMTPLAGVAVYQRPPPSSEYFVVETPEQFQTWVAQQQAPVTAMTGDAAKGEQLFLNGACIACHTVNGTKAQGKVGPNLTHLASRKLFAGAVFDNTADNLKKWLANPPAMKPGTQMPNLNLAPADIDALVAYLTSLK